MRTPHGAGRCWKRPPPSSRARSMPARIMIWWTGLALWEFEIPFPGSLTCTFQVALHLPTRVRRSWKAVNFIVGNDRPSLPGPGLRLLFMTHATCEYWLESHKEEEETCQYPQLDHQQVVHSEKRSHPSRGHPSSLLHYSQALS